MKMRSMKKMLFFGSATLVAGLSSSTFALESSMNLIGRMDYLSTTQKTNGGSKTTAGNFTPNYLQLETSAKFNSTTDVKLILNFAAKQDVATTRNLSEHVDEITLIKKLYDGLSIKLGKQSLMIGGREWDYYDKDLYFKSKFWDAGNTNQIGATLSYEASGQKVHVQFLENAGTSSLKDKKIAGVTYYGSFLNDMIAPIFSYHKEGTDRPGKYNLLTATGVKVVYNAVVAEVDYLMRKEEGNGSPDAKLNSLVAHLRYNHEMFKPFVKYFMETGKDGFDFGNSVGGTGITKSERNTYEVGLEVVPNKDEDMRYHAVYSSTTAKEKTGGTDKFEDTKITLGLAFGFNILK